MKTSFFTSSRFRTVAVMALAVGAAGAWAIFRWQHRGTAMASSRTGSGAASVTGSEAGELSHHWRAGAGFAFRCRSTARMEFTDSGLQVSSANTDMEVQGVWHVRVLSVSDGEVRLAAQMSGAQLTSGGARQQGIESLLNETPCVAILGLNGQLRSTRLPASVPVEDRAVLEGICASLQCVLPEAPAASWTTTETADGQKFTCSYRALPDGTLTKERRPAAAADQQAGVTVKVTASSFRVRPGAVWLNSLSGDETAVCLMQGREVARSHSSVSFTALPADEAGAAPPALLALGSAKSLASFTAAPSGTQNEAATQRAQQEAQRAALVRRWEKVPASEVIGSLTQSVAASKTHADTIESMHALRDWLTVHPDKAGDIARSMMDAAMPDAVTLRIAHALELAGATSPESQQALAEILTAPAGTWPPGVVLQATAAAGGVGANQSPELLAALRQTAASQDPGEEFQTSDAALFALGILSKDNPALRGELVTALSPRLETGGPFNAGDTEAALYTLANARIADPELTAKAQSLAAGHADPAVRAAALEMLRFTGETGAAVAQNALTDASEQVQRKAVEVLASPDTGGQARISPLMTMLENPATSPRLLPALVSALAAHRTTEPAVTPAFERLLARTEDAGLQQQIITAMNNGQ